MIADKPNNIQQITFSVDDVEPATMGLSMGNLRASLEVHARRHALWMPEADRPAVVRQSTGHALIETVHRAFNQHRPLVLSPDVIWFVITQGFGHHLKEHAEELRGRIVSHEGRKELHAEMNSFDIAAWQRFAASICSQISAASDPVLHKTLLCDFSTTTPFIRTASEMALMDAYQPYFKYGLTMICGIPEITLEGTPADWQSIRDRVEVLATFGLEWWVSRLRPILDQFVTTSKGAPALDFWQAIFKPRTFYTSESVMGWISDLFPYLYFRHSGERRRNHVLDTPRVDWITQNSGPGWAGVGTSVFGTGLSEARVDIKPVTADFEYVDVVAGFCGIGQTPSNALYPIISWSVMKSNTEPVATPKQTHHPTMVK